MIMLQSMEEEKMVPMSSLRPPALVEHKLTLVELLVESTLHIRRRMPPKEVRECEYIPKVIKMKEP